MKNQFSFICQRFGISLSVGAFLVAALFAASAESAQYLVKYRSAAAFQTVQNLSFQTYDAPSAPKLSILNTHSPGNLILVDIPKGAVVSTLTSLYADPSIEYVVPNFKLHSYLMPGYQKNYFKSGGKRPEVLGIQAQAVKEQWHVAKVNAPEAWKLVGHRGKKEIVVAVIDTGVDYQHESLAPNMIPGYDFRENDSDPMDKVGARNPGHGTHCAGIIGSTGLIEGGTVGISPEVSMMPLRFLGEDGSGDLNAAIRAIDYAIEKNVNVISASWGATVPRDQARPLIEAIERADTHGIIFVAAAANDGNNNDVTDVFPTNAGTPNMISVAASGPSDDKPSWSNYGQATVSLAAPGLDIMSTLPNGSYGNLSGTSMATPMVSGLVALLKAQDPSLTGAQIRSILQLSGAKAPIETACHCRVDALAAMEMVLNKKMAVIPAAMTLIKDATLQINPIFGEAPFKYSSSNTQVLTIDEKGVLKAVGDGSAVVNVTDARGATAQTLEYFVGLPKAPPTPPPGGGLPNTCPIGDKELCDIMCRMKPELPFCKKS